jgi:hypothetical protein
MGLLKKDNHSKTYKLIGASIPLWLHHYLSLYCLAKSKTKSEVMKGWVDAWYSQVKPNEPQEKLVQEIIEKIHVEWTSSQKNTPEKTMDEFKKELETEMINRGLNPFQISIILKATK